MGSSLYKHYKYHGYIGNCWYDSNRSCYTGRVINNENWVEYDADDLSGIYSAMTDAIDEWFKETSEAGLEMDLPTDIDIEEFIEIQKDIRSLTLKNLTVEQKDQLIVEILNKGVEL